MTEETSNRNTNYRLRYTLVGILFGLCFPLLSTLVWIYTNGMPFTIQSFILVHLQTPLQWFINTAPVFLGLFAYMAGVRQDRVEDLNLTLRRQLEERDALVSQLESVRVSLEKTVHCQVLQLLTAAEVAREALTIQELEELLHRTVHLISERFGFYHTGIFLVDPTREFAVLRAASSEGGRRMLVRQHKLKIGEVGIVGHAAARAEPRIALDVGDDATFFNNPDLPLTCSEMALPLVARSQLIGVLDVQSEEKNAFTDEDLKILQTLADQIALAIDNALLLADSQATLLELQHLYQVQEGKAWRQLLESRELEFEYDLTGVHQGQPGGSPVSQNPQDDPSTLLRLPIALRGQSLGSIELERDPGDPPWAPEEQELIQTTINQMVLSLENARLLEETQQRAEYERLLAQLSARLWASGDVNTILRAALEELGRALHVSDGVIRIEAPELIGKPVDFQP